MKDNFKYTKASEEEQKYETLLSEAELKSETKSENIKNTHAEILDKKNQELIYPFKLRHVFCKKSTGLGITAILQL